MDRSDKVMGIDPSLTGFAMVIMGDDCYERKEISTTSSKWGKTVRGRIARYRHLLGSCLEFAEKYDVSQFFVEGYSFASRGQAVITLAEFGGVLRDRLLWRNNLVLEIAPTMLKKFATGKGNANKILVLQEIAKRYGIFFDSDNLGDAYIAAKIGRILIGKEAVSNLLQSSVIDKLQSQYLEVSG